jgi:hypothetical protein
MLRTTGPPIDICLVGKIDGNPHIGIFSIKEKHPSFTHYEYQEFNTKAKKLVQPIVESFIENGQDSVTLYDADPLDVNYLKEPYEIVFKDSFELFGLDRKEVMQELENKAKIVEGVNSMINSILNQSEQTSPTVQDRKQARNIDDFDSKLFAETIKTISKTTCLFTHDPPIDLFIVHPLSEEGQATIIIIPTILKSKHPSFTQNRYRDLNAEITRLIEPMVTILKEYRKLVCLHNLGVVLPHGVELDRNQLQDYEAPYNTFLSLIRHPHEDFTLAGAYRPPIKDQKH